MVVSICQFEVLVLFIRRFGFISIVDAIVVDRLTCNEILIERGQ